MIVSVRDLTDSEPRQLEADAHETVSAMFERHGLTGMTCICRGVVVSDNTLVSALSVPSVQIVPAMAAGQLGTKPRAPSDSIVAVMTVQVAGDQYDIQIQGTVADIAAVQAMDLQADVNRRLRPETPPQRPAHKIPTLRERRERKAKRKKHRATMDKLMADIAAKRAQRAELRARKLNNASNILE